VISPDGQIQPEEQALLADSVGLALLIVLDTLTPDERLAFVLHDMFDLPFKEIASVVGRTPAAAKQLASRARRRVKGAEIPADPDVARQREVIDAFFAAARRGDFDALVAVLHPDVLLRADTGTPRIDALFRIHGSATVAKQVARGLRGWLRNRAAEVCPVLVNGSAGAVITMDGKPILVLGFTIADGKIGEIDGISDPARLARIAAAVRTAG
jgi:RNA polymerase sigma-70 factor (ECF subfamily)